MQKIKKFLQSFQNSKKKKALAVAVIVLTVVGGGYLLTYAQ